MDKNTQKKDTVYEEPNDEIQARINLIMGLPADEAAPTLNKYDKPNVIKRLRQGQSLEELKINQEVQKTVNNMSKTTIESAIESNETEKAVSEIIKTEADKTLEVEDAKKASFEIKPKPKNIFNRIFTTWWGNKLVRNLTLFVLVTGLLAIFIFPQSRYATLNAVGVRAGMSFKVIDKISGRPVKNVSVNINGVESISSEDGTVNVTGLKLGDTELVLSKRSFEDLSVPVVIGWGSNPFVDPIEVVPTGTTFEFNITDWLDKKAIKEAEITDGESVGVSDQDGIARITIEPTDDDIDITVSSGGYRNEIVKIPANVTAAQKVELVPSKPDVFISKRSGKYDVYVRDIDGQNENIILPATGSEQPDINVLANDTNDNTAALVSSRAGIRNDEGYILSDLYILDINSKTANKIEATQSERIRLIGWHNNELVFVKTIAGPSAGFSTRQRVVTYNTETEEITELASANYFNDVRLIGDKVYYVISSGAGGSQSKGLSRIDLNGEGRIVLVGDDVWSIYRMGINELVISAANNKWYSLELDSKKLSRLEGSPAQTQDIEYVFSPDNKTLARVETRDGKTVLLTKDLDSEDSNEKELLRLSGISYPLIWVNSNAIKFTVANSNETASYVMSLDGEKPIVIGDITASVYSQAYYY